MRVRHYVSGLLAAVALAFSMGVAAKTTLKFSIGAPESSGGEILGMKALKEYVEFKSGGEIEIRLFFNTFGGSLQVTEQVKNGTLEMALTDDSVLGSFHKPMQVFQIPYLFASSPVAWEFMKSPFVRELNDDMRKATGIRTLALSENGFRNLTNSKRPVTKVEVFDGVKVRVMQNNIFLDTFKTLGTNAVPMAFGEVFTALETKTIDGQENPFVTIETSKFNEVQKYLSVTRHAYTPFLVLYSKKLWDQLNPQEQAVLREAAMEGQKVQRAANRTLNEKSLASLKTKGMQVNEVNSAEQNRIRAKVASVYDKHKDSIGADAIKVVQDELRKARGG